MTLALRSLGLCAAAALAGCGLVVDGDYPVDATEGPPSDSAIDATVDVREMDQRPPTDRVVNDVPPPDAVERDRAEVDSTEVADVADESTDAGIDASDGDVLDGDVLDGDVLDGDVSDVPFIDVPSDDGGRVRDGTIGDEPPPDPCAVLPRLTFPLSGSVVNTLRPSLRWEDTARCSGVYGIEVATNRDFTGTIILLSAAEGETQSALNVDLSITPTTYFWRVIRRSGTSITRSRVSEFRTSAARGVSLSASLRSSASGAMPDLDFDGKSDLIIGTPSDDITRSPSGVVSIVYGGAQVASTTPIVPYTVTGATVGLSGVSAQTFGARVSSLGDTNDDGYPDVLVATGTQDYVILFGSPSGLTHTSAGVRRAPTTLQSGGSLPPIVGVGDADNDGRGDLAMGLNDRGVPRVVVLAGPDFSRVIQSETGTGNFGAAIAPAGDVNNDGRADVVIGSPALGFGTTGPVSLFLSGSATPFMNLSSSAYAMPPASSAGSWVAGLGDFTGDGIPDFSFGQTDAWGHFAGSAAMVYRESRVAPIVLPPGRLTTVAYAGNLDNNGGAEVVSTRQGFPGTRVYSFLSGATTDRGVFSTLLIPRAAGSAGDLNGDGFDDLVLLVVQSTPAVSQAHIYFGGTSPGLIPDRAFDVPRVENMSFATLF